MPRPVEAVCLRLLAKTPEARYPSAVALHEALEELRARTDVDWTGVLHPERRPAVKPRASMGRVLAAVGVGLAVALGAWWFTPGQEVAPGGDAPEPRRAVAAPLPESPRKDSAPVKQPQTSDPQPPSAGEPPCATPASVSPAPPCRPA